MRALTDSCANDLHERCDRKVNVIPGHSARCTCECHDNAILFPLALLAAGALATMFVAGALLAR